jgi:rfaE bifunctional protein nucleotidyltransferase chain/domain
MIINTDQDLEKFSTENSQPLILTNGCFDILHVGHLRYLQASKALDPQALLIVGLNSDSSVKKLKGDKRPINSELERAELLLGLKPVDHVIIFSESTASKLLLTLRPIIYTKGGDYDLNDYEKCPEFKVANEINCKIILINFEQGYSSTKSISLLGSNQNA